MDTTDPRLPDAPPAPDAVLTPTPLTELQRHPERGSYDRATLHAIVDEALICHVGIAVDEQPFVLPMMHARIEDDLYLHGSPRSRLLRALAAGHRAAVTFTLLDGLVLARSAFHHSMNYRSVVALGVATEVTDEGEKRRALDALVDRAAPGRHAEVRPPSAGELAGTLVLRLRLSEASAKIRSGPPLDSRPDRGGDQELAVWAGELPLRLRAGAPRRAPELRPQITSSPSLRTQASALGGPLATPHEEARGEYLISTDPSRLDHDVVHRFLAQESYWAQGVDAARQAAAMANALCFGLFHLPSGAQVGMARVVTDFARIAYLGDVFVLREHRGRGLGKWLVEAVLAHPALRGLSRFILATKDAHGLYARYGFSPVEPGRHMALDLSPLSSPP
jgi:nitroimidazol reductase NimA-like FMN-containing flavoprotein (pyridoxamine 5'-phosphate oxidase superfamily)/GNAT superfamily N-acetyltransferase